MALGKEHASQMGVGGRGQIPSAVMFVEIFHV